MRRVRLGIIGAGQISEVHVKGYTESERGSVIAVCDLVQDLAIERALLWGADRYYNDYRELLANPDIDAVAILTPHDVHATMAVDALEAGKHVHLARPLALSLSDADAVIAAARQYGKIVSVCEPDLFSGPLNDTKNYLETGEVGQALAINISITIGAPDGGWAIRPESWLWRFDPDRSGGGPFLFDAIHGGLVAAFYLMGPIQRTEAWIGRTEIYPGYHVDAPATLMWTHASGVVGSMSLTYSPEMYIKSDYYPTSTKLEVTGTRGALQLRLSPGQLGSSAPLVMHRDGRSFAFGEVDDRWHKAYEKSSAAFIDDVADGRTPLCAAEAGRSHLAVTLAVRESSLTETTQTPK